MTRLLKLIAASVVLGVILLAAAVLRPHYEQQVFHRKEIAVVAVSGVAVGVYALLLAVLRVVTPAQLRAALRRSPRAKSGDTPAPDLP